MMNQNAMMIFCRMINQVGRRQNAWAEIKMMMLKTKNIVQK